MYKFRNHTVPNGRRLAYDWSASNGFNNHTLSATQITKHLTLTLTRTNTLNLNPNLRPLSHTHSYFFRLPPCCIRMLWLTLPRTLSPPPLTNHQTPMICHGQAPTNPSPSACYVLCKPPLVRSNVQPKILVHQLNQNSILKIKIEIVILST